MMISLSIGICHCKHIRSNRRSPSVGSSHMLDQIPHKSLKFLWHPTLENGSNTIILSTIHCINCWKVSSDIMSSEVAFYSHNFARSFAMCRCPLANAVDWALRRTLPQPGAMAVAGSRGANSSRRDFFCWKLWILGLQKKNGTSAALTYINPRVFRWQCNGISGATTGWIPSAKWGTPPGKYANDRLTWHVSLGKHGNLGAIRVSQCGSPPRSLLWLL